MELLGLWRAAQPSTANKQYMWHFLSLGTVFCARSPPCTFDRCDALVDGTKWGPIPMGTATKTEVYPYAPYVNQVVTNHMYLDAAPDVECFGHKYDVHYTQPSELSMGSTVDGTYCQYRECSGRHRCRRTHERCSECAPWRPLRAEGNRRTPHGQQHASDELWQLLLRAALLVGAARYRSRSHPANVMPVCRMTCTNVHPCQGYATDGVSCYLNYGFYVDNLPYLISATGMRFYDKVSRY